MSAIEWTDETWNPVTGCDRVSPGCAHCYALDLAARLKAMGQPRYQRDGDPKTSGPGFGLTLHPDKLDEPLRWRKPRMVFVNSMSDLFHEAIPDEFIYSVLDVMSACPQHTFQVLTKRPERARDLLARVDAAGPDWGVWRLEGADRMLVLDRDLWPRGRGLRNVWLGVSIENARYTWRADVLREIPAAVRFISAEPLLGSLLTPTRCGDCNGEGMGPEIIQFGNTVAGRNACETCHGRGELALDLTGIDWLIAGGESGGRFARPMHPAWARELRDACVEPRVEDHACPDCERTHPWRECGTSPRPAFFFKQWGSWRPFVRELDEPSGTDVVVEDATESSGAAVLRYAGAGPKSGGRLLDGREWHEIPTTREPVAA